MSPLVLKIGTSWYGWLTTNGGRFTPRKPQNRRLGGLRAVEDSLEKK